MLGSPIVLVACQPKSGSTFFSTAICNITGYSGAVLVPDWNRREQEIDGRLIAKHRRKLWVRGHVAHNHVRNSAATEKLVERYGVRPLVMVRNLYDVVPSIRDHIRKESLDWPMAWFTEAHKDLPDDDLDYAIARLAMPWYLNFYMSWRQSRRAFFLAYEDMVEAPAVALLNACTTLALGEYSLEDAERAVKAARGRRLNVGKVGRGKQLAPRVREAVADIIAQYPEARDDEYIKSMDKPQP